MSRILTSIPLFYLVLLWPGRYVIIGLWDGDWYYAQMMYDSGVWSVRLLLMTIAVTPILLVIGWLGRGQAFGRWLLRRRRHLGLLSFIYASLHLTHYILETKSVSQMWREALWLEFAAGWVAFVVFAVLAVTSNSWSVRRLGRRWKRLHYWIYPAIGLVFLHWFLFDQLTERVVFWLVLFLALKLAHGGARWLRRAITAGATRAT